MNLKTLNPLFYFDLENTTQHADISCLNKKELNMLAERMERTNKITTNDPDYSAKLEKFYQDTAPVLPEYGKIICMSYGIVKADNIIINSFIETEEREEALVTMIHKAFNKIEGKFTLCGWNIKAYDIPWLIKKFIKYGLDVPKILNFANKKPWEIEVLDLKELWKFNSYFDCTFDECCYMLGIESPKAEMSGKDVYSEYYAGNLAKIVKYCESDVKALISVEKKLTTHL